MRYRTRAGSMGAILRKPIVEGTQQLAIYFRGRKWDGRYMAEEGRYRVYI